jgi:nucleoside-diphosphate-sugar epimerase
VPTLLHENCEIGPTSYYGLSKYLSESTCKYYADNFGLSVAVLRIFNMYGPNQNKSFLIPDLIDQINTTKEINLRTPFVVRDFVHVDDVAQAFISMCNFVYNGCVIMNVGTGIGLSPFEIIRCLDINANINTQKIENRKIDYVIADVTRINQLISWKAKISVQKGLKDILKKH